MKQTKASIFTAVFGAIVAFVFLYWNAFGDLLGHWNNEDFSYCYLVPIVAGYLVYTDRNKLRGIPVESSCWGLLVVAVSGVLFLAGRMGSLETIVYLSIWMTVLGMTLAAFGPALLKKLVFPLAVLFFIIPVPPFLNQLFTFKLKLISSKLAVDLMSVAGLSVFREGNVIDIGVTQLQVVDACSGLRFVYPLILMGLIVGYLFHKKWWERAIMVAITVPISVGSNALRIAITGVLTETVSPQLAEGFFHGFSGWFIFMSSLGILMLVGWMIKGMGRKARGMGQESVQTESSEPGAESPALSASTFHLSAGPLSCSAAILLSFTLVQYGLASGIVRPARTQFARFPTQIGDWQGEKSYLGDDILKALWADDYVQIQFVNTSTPWRLSLFVPYYAWQDTKHCAHAPLACLLGGGWAQLSRAELTRAFPPPLGATAINQVLLEKDGEKMLANFWFQQRGRIISSEYMNKWYLFQDAITRRRTDGALVRIEMPLAPGQDINEAQKVLDEFTQKLEKILPKFVPS
ncbi:MAG: VPLPA-CTERM-specific exosortase XrtD [Pseudomonadota bacterium]